MRGSLKTWVLALLSVWCCVGIGRAQEESSNHLSKKAVEYRLAGYRYQQQGDLDNAIASYRKALEEDPSYITAQNDLGIVYEQKGLYDAAERSYLAAVKADPEYKGAHSNLAYFYENKGDVDKAVYYWKKRLALEGPAESDWSKKAKEKLSELEQRRQVREMMTDEEKDKQDKALYEKKKRLEKSEWKPRTKEGDIDQEMGNRYFDKGMELYRQHQYDEALMSFKMARTYKVHEQDVNWYTVKIQKIKEALAGSDITGEKPYENVVPKEDLMLARDHFKMGLDYYGKQDYERAFSSFTMAMTYNPYDEVIQKYVEDSKIKIEEEKVKTKQLKENAQRSGAAALREPMDVRRDMINDKNEVVGKGFVATSEDMSVESFIDDGKQLFANKRYEDAIYVWKQAMLLDVEGVYRDSLHSLISQAEADSHKKQDAKWGEESHVAEEQALADVTKAAIPSAQGGAPDWALRSREKLAKLLKEDSPDVKAVKEKLQTRYSLNFKDASLKGVVDILVELTGLNIVIDTKAISQDDINQNNITFKVADMPLIEIIEAVLRFTDFDYLIENNMIWVTSKDKIRTEDMVMVVYDVQDIIGKIFDFPAEKLGEGFSRREGSVGPETDKDNNYNNDNNSRTTS